MKRNTISCSDALKGLKSLPDNSVDVMITSPPYWSLRDYHVKGQLGLEPNADDYLDNLWEIFREVKRVLKENGTCWVNLGDKYGTDKEPFIHSRRESTWAKCLLGLPERFILGMQEDGWFLRNKIIWHKPNAMPSAVKDRLSNSWEYVFFFSKSSKYYFDLDAIREPHKSESLRRAKNNWNGTTFDGCNWKGLKPDNMCHPLGKNPGDMIECNGILNNSTANLYKSNHIAPHPMGKNPSDCWNIATKGFRGAHFATFPEKLIERAIKASPTAICTKCGKAKRRITKATKSDEVPNRSATAEKAHSDSGKARLAQPKTRYITKHTTVGWKSCDCNVPFKPAVILDPFMGSGTTGVVSKRLGRDYLGFELNPDYVKMAEERIDKVEHDRSD